MIECLKGARVLFISNDFHNGSHGSFKPGDRVVHATFRHGTIIGEWGCFHDVDPLDGRCLDISGAGIFEVRFDREIHSVNANSLTLVESAPSVHPLAQKFPPLNAEDFANLKASIEKNGQLQAIIVNERGQILDGVHRSRACRELGIKPRTVQFSELSAKSPGILSEAQFIYDANVERRHLSPTQKAALVLEFLPLMRQEAEARRRIAQTKGRATQKERRSNGEAASTEPRKWRRGPTTDQVLAQKAGVGRPVMQAVIAAHDHAPELLPELSSGRLCAAEAIEMIAAKRKKAKSETNGSGPKEAPVPPDVGPEVVNSFKEFLRELARKHHLSVTKVRNYIVEHLSAL